MRLPPRAPAKTAALKIAMFRTRMNDLLVSGGRRAVRRSLQRLHELTQARREYFYRRTRNGQFTIHFKGRWRRGQGGALGRGIYISDTLPVRLEARASGGRCIGGAGTKSRRAPRARACATGGC